MRVSRLLRGSAVLLAGALAAAGCGKSGTYVVVELRAGTGTPAGIRSVDLDLMMAGRSASTTFTGKGSGDITLPTDATLDIGSGAGALTITARARGADGALLDTGSGAGNVVTGGTAHIVVQLGAQPGDGGAGDGGAGRDGSSSDTSGSGGAGGAGSGGSSVDGSSSDGAGSDGPSPPQVVADRDSFDFGTVVVGSASGATVITIRNAGGQRTGALVAGVVDAVTFPTSQDGCNGTALDPGASCTISVKLQPSAAGSKSTTLRVAGSPGGTASVALSGLAVDPGALAIAPDHRDFGPIPQGQQSGELTFTVSNTGGAPTSALMASLTGSDAAEFKLSSDGCSNMTLQAGAMCTIGVKLAPSPSGAVGAKNASLTVSAATGGTAVGGLTGSALGPAALAVVPTDQDFGMVVQGMKSQEILFTVQNGGGQTSGALVAGIAPTGEFAISTNNCDGMMLAPAATCTIGIKMTPGGTGGRSATLTVRGSPGGAALANLRGTGLAPGMVVLSPSPKDFSIVDVGSPSSADFTVTNSGGAATTALSVTPAGATEFSVTNDACTGRTLAAAGQCTFTIVFAPSTYGARSGSVTVSAATGGSATAALSGVGRDYVALTVMKTGTGGGNVAATGLQCSATTCTGQYPRTTAGAFQQVTLSAAPDAYSTFAGWMMNGGCTGASPCTVTMDSAKMVIATFTAKNVKVTVTNVGLAGQSGTVTAGDGTLTCAAGSTCGPLDHPATPSFTLVATPTGGSTFIGWSGGGCKGVKPTCTVALTSDMSVTATFGPQAYMFITSSLIIPGRLGGVAGADTECTNRAAAANLPGTYRAWISNTGVDANARVGSGGWVRVDGRPFASGIAALKTKINQPVYYPPRVDENGNDLGPTHLQVATGGNNDGSNFGVQCNNYTSTTGSLYVGVAAAGTMSWAYSYLDSQGCVTPAHLYCFRSDLTAAIAPPPVAGRAIFTSDFAFTPGGGIGAADAQCQGDAMAAGLPNFARFIALLATSNASAVSRVSLTGLPWRRADQVLVVADPADLATGNLLAPIDLSADGMQYASRAVWSGAADVASKASDGYACNDWMTAVNASGSYFGYPNFGANPDWFNSGRLTCDYVNVYLTCVEP
jgi:hypothetical protein